MIASSQVESEVAVGAGVSDRITVVGAGLVNFPRTGVNMTFGGTHPNPVKDVLNIRFPNLTTGISSANVKIMNTTGQILYDFNTSIEAYCLLKKYNFCLLEST